MELGILSDTHNNIVNLKKALKVFHASNVQILIHCGDITDPAVAKEMNGFKVIHVLGNCDVDAEGIKHALLSCDTNNISQDQYTGSIERVQFAVIHGDDPTKLQQLIASGNYHFVFHGHTHRRRDETIGFSRVINPGALGGQDVLSRSFCILDLASGYIRFLEV